MKHSHKKWITLVFALSVVLMLGACKKKVAPPPPPPPPPPAAPTASLTANPSTIQKGQSTTLTWETQNATDVSIDGISLAANYRTAFGEEVRNRGVEGLIALLAKKNRRPGSRL